MHAFANALKYLHKPGIKAAVFDPGYVSDNILAV